MKESGLIKEAMQNAAFQIISIAGAAKSDYMEALESARHGDFKTAYKKVENGRKKYLSSS